MLSNIASGIRTLLATSASSLQGGNHTFTEFWHRKMRTHFNKMDMNGDGYVSRDDVKALVKSLASKANLGEQRAFLMQRLVIQLWEDFWCCGEDKGFDYLLPIDEFINLMKSLNKLSDCKDHLVEPLGLLFGVIDLNGIGRFTLREWLIYQEVIGNTISDATLSFDTCFEGKTEITKDDFVSVGQAFFTKKDENHSSRCLWGPLV